ncbi:MAG: hypothetical protein IPJ65_42705 [Archangiaceae bacterium]|nr:hypothetical protein [Archangiaceae bacterium]
MSRHSVKNAIAGSAVPERRTVQASVRYGRNALATVALRRALMALNVAEREALKARRLVLETRRRAA